GGAGRAARGGQARRAALSRLGDRSRASGGPSVGRRERRQLNPGPICGPTNNLTSKFRPQFCSKVPSLLLFLRSAVRLDGTSNRAGKGGLDAVPEPLWADQSLGTI